MQRILTLILSIYRYYGSPTLDNFINSNHGYMGPAVPNSDRKRLKNDHCAAKKLP